MGRYTVESGRRIARDGKPIVFVDRDAGEVLDTYILTPVQADDLTHEIAAALNVVADHGLARVVADVQRSGDSIHATHPTTGFKMGFDTALELVASRLASHCAKAGLVFDRREFMDAAKGGTDR